jgi:hypothetical protein
MIIPHLAVPIAVYVTVAQGLPNWDVTASCRGAASAGYVEQSTERLKSCLASEQQTRDKLAGEWSSFNAADRMTCVRSINWFEPTYSELAACLELARDAKSGGSGNSASPMR